MNRFSCTIFGFLFITALIFSCVEEFDISTDVENALIADKTLVVEATITDSLQTQKIILSRAVSFENDSIVEFDDNNLSTSLYLPQTRERPIVYEENADVKIETDNGKIFQFVEGQDGHYLSVNPFKAEFGSKYRLLIKRANGESIISEFEELVGRSRITNLKAEKGDNQIGEAGLYFIVDGFSDENSQAAYYRYVYEETFKIIAPLWSTQDFKLISYDPAPCDTIFARFEIDLVPRQQETKTCYRTEYSEEIIQQTTQNFGNQNVSNFPVYFIKQADYAIANRYSIMVTQYVEDADAYLYYDRLKSFSKSTNVFYQVQPGFLKGNLEASTNELVIGYFSVASISQKRIFLDYNDFFTGSPIQPYLVNCRYLSSPDTHPTRCPEVEDRPINPCPPSLVELLNDGNLISYFSLIDLNLVPTAQCPGSYIYVPKICGDCNVLGENVKPTFWTD